MLLVIAKRLAISIPTLLIIALLTFLSVHLVPGDVAVTVLGERATPEQLQNLRDELGLDLPFMTQFANWLGGFLTGDMGRSLVFNQDVSVALRQRAVVTLTIAVIGVVVTAVVGVTLGIVSALNKDGRIDRALMALTSVGLSVPNFWAAVIFVYLFAVLWSVLPSGGWTPFAVDPGMWALRLVLPVAALVVVPIAVVSRQTRASFTSVLGKDYIRSLRAAGVSQNKIVYKHALRNAAIPITTIIGIQFVLLLGGSVVIETVFALPGIGQLAIDAVTARDLPVIQGVVIFVAVIVLGVNFVLDLVYAWLNPKVRIS